jgi:hypothetical protein
MSLFLPQSQSRFLESVVLNAIAFSLLAYLGVSHADEWQFPRTHLGYVVFELLSLTLQHHLR